MASQQRLELRDENREGENRSPTTSGDQAKAKRPKTMKEAMRTSSLLRPIIWAGLKDR